MLRRTSHPYPRSPDGPRLRSPTAHAAKSPYRVSPRRAIGRAERAHASVDPSSLWEVAALERGLPRLTVRSQHEALRQGQRRPCGRHRAWTGAWEQADRRASRPDEVDATSPSTFGGASRACHCGTRARRPAPAGWWLMWPSTGPVRLQSSASRGSPRAGWGPAWSALLSSSHRRGLSGCPAWRVPSQRCDRAVYGRG
jgi:hypothetical protein